MPDSGRLSASMVEMFDDHHEAISHSYMNQKIAWLEVADRQAADRLLVRLEGDVTIKNVEIAETVVESRPVIHVSGKIIDSDFQLYLVWPIDGVTK
jgi:hypothetical protein